MGRRGGRGERSGSWENARLEEGRCGVKWVSAACITAIARCSILLRSPRLKQHKKSVEASSSSQQQQRDGTSVRAPACAPEDRAGSNESVICTPPPGHGAVRSTLSPPPHSPILVGFSAPPPLPGAGPAAATPPPADTAAGAQLSAAAAARTMQLRRRNGLLRAPCCCCALAAALPRPVRHAWSRCVRAIVALLLLKGCAQTTKSALFTTITAGAIGRLGTRSEPLPPRCTA